MPKGAAAGADDDSDSDDGDVIGDVGDLMFSLGDPSSSNSSIIEIEALDHDHPTSVSSPPAGPPIAAAIPTPDMSVRGFSLLLKMVKPAADYFSRHFDLLSLRVCVT